MSTFQTGWLVKIIYFWVRTRAFSKIETLCYSFKLVESASLAKQRTRKLRERRIFHNWAHYFLSEFKPTFLTDTFEQSGDDFYVGLRSDVLGDVQTLASFYLVEAMVQ